MQFENGVAFVNDLVEKYGLLEGYRMADKYLETPEDGTEDEAYFRQGVRFGMWKVDQI